MMHEKAADKVHRAAAKGHGAFPGAWAEGLALAMPGWIGLGLFALGPGMVARLALLIIMVWAGALAMGLALSCMTGGIWKRSMPLTVLMVLGAPLSLALPLPAGLIMLTLALLAAASVHGPEHPACRALRSACAFLAPVVALMGGVLIAAS